LASPQNWAEISSTSGTASQIYFASAEYTEGKLYPMEKSPNIVIAPEALYIKNKPGTSEEKFVKINNWGKGSPEGLYNFCIKFESPKDVLGYYDPVSMLGYPRIEAYDSQYSLDIYQTPTKELLVGTKTESLPLLRAIDLTEEAAGLVDSGGWPPDNWWFNATYGSGVGRIKALSGTSSYLECSSIIKPAGGYVYLPGNSSAYVGQSYSEAFYFSVCAVIPPDSYRGMIGHDIILTCRSHFI